jgi:hypothetical protein
LLHYLQASANPAVRRALLTYVTRLLDIELGVSRLDDAVKAFCAQCDQVVAYDAATQAYVRQLEQAYDAALDEEPQQMRDEDASSETLMRELEDFLRQQRERGGEA